jgi:hypothetical protein
LCNTDREVRKIQKQKGPRLCFKMMRTNCPEGVCGPRLCHTNVKHVWGLRPHTFSTFVLRKFGPQTPSGHNFRAILIYIFIFYIFTGLPGGVDNYNARGHVCRMTAEHEECWSHPHHPQSPPSSRASHFWVIPNTNEKTSGELCRNFEILDRSRRPRKPVQNRSERFVRPFLVRFRPVWEPIWSPIDDFQPDS